MHDLPVERGDKPYGKLIDAICEDRKRVGDHRTDAQLKSYMIDILSSLDTSISDLRDRVIGRVAELNIGERNDDQIALAESCWKLLEANGLENDFTHQTACFARCLLCVISFNMRTQSTDDIMFWFFNFLDPLACGENRALALFPNYFPQAGSETS